MRTAIVPLRNIQFKPAFWGVDRNLSEVMKSMENVWEGNETHLNNFKETDQAFLMSIDMPGVNRENLEIETEGETLFINAKRNIGFSSDEESTQNISKSVRLPKQINKEKIQAHCKDGVLFLAFPKEEKAKPLKIKIQDEMNGTDFFNQIEDKNIK